MTTFLTGGTGFFGKSLVKALADQGREVRVLARKTSDISGLDLPGVSIHYGDIEDAESIRKGLEGCDTFFHGAAVVKELVKDRSIFDRVNVTALDQAFALAKQAGVQRVVYTSSFFAIGPSDQAPERIADETHKRRLKYCTDYERTKFLAEDIVAKHVNNGLHVASVLPGFIFGPGDMTEGNLIVRTLLDLEAGKLPALPGGGKKLWCLAYTKDVVRGHLLALEKGKAGGRYLIGGDNVPLKEILVEYHRLGGRKPPGLSVPFFMVDLLGYIDEKRWQLFGSDVALSRGKACAARHDWAYSSKLAEQELGYSHTPWKDILALTVDWMKAEGLMG